MKIRLERDEFWPYMFESHSGVLLEIPRKLWESYEAARKAFEAEHKKLMTSIEDQGRTAEF
jgi:hypothetical protein